jgi:hypothetical protein
MFYRRPRNDLLACYVEKADRILITVSGKGCQVDFGHKVLIFLRSHL